VPNFYTDNPDILFHLKNMDLSRVIDLKENRFVEKDEFSYAPMDADDAKDNYGRVLDIVGEIAGDFVADRAAEVDRVGAVFEDGEVIYAPGTLEALERLKKADLMGFTLPRKYGGINMPKTVYSIAIEMISRADAALMNIFGLQEIADTIYHFGSEDQKTRFLPRFASGAVMGAMSLTEPDAGSDLQAIMLKSHENEDGQWVLNGVKRFITNGCADVSLVMARSEEGSSGGRGISLFIYERDSHMKIRRIEHKLGIHGSPTCELQFDDAPAELMGRRKMGLVKYTMALMNGARLGVAAQAVGIAEAAFREARQYAASRVQFKKPIHEFTAVYEMLTDMKVGIEAARTLLYETSRIVDIKEGIEHRMADHPDSQADLKADAKRYAKYAALFTPLVKAYAAETANRICYDAIQIHGGVGFTCEFNVERHYRDARITNIYEGTTQLQVVAAIGGIMGGVVTERLNDWEEETDFSRVAGLFETIREFRATLERAVSHIKGKKDPVYQEYHARRLVEMAMDTVLGYLMCRDALLSDLKKKTARIFLTKASHRVTAGLNYILSDDMDVIDYHDDIIGGQKL
jgi:3-(methylthio)propanoyl-CoA dehydrogenase